MKKIIDSPDRVVDDMLEGFLKAAPGRVAATANPRVLRYAAAPVPGKVGIVTGGGSGHKPAFIGYIGRNLVDAVAVGEIFSSPPARMFYDAFVAADSGRGVACLYGNYAGDNMNVAIAMEMAREAGIAVEAVVADDDVPSGPPGRARSRRGVAGEILMWKVGGARAAMGGDLQAVTAAARKAIANTRSMGIGLSPCTIPEVGRPNFTIEDGMMEVGIGHHGEPGIAIAPLESAAAMAGRCLDAILPDLPFVRGDRVAVLVSGLGSTPLMEQFIFFNDVEKRLALEGIGIRRSYVGNYFTSLEMNGITLTLMKLDDELEACLDLEADSYGLTQSAIRPAGC